VPLIVVGTVRRALQRDWRRMLKLGLTIGVVAAIALLSFK
jgi:hypothetical protein